MGKWIRKPQKINHWRLTKSCDGDKIEKLFRTQKEMAEYLEVSTMIIKLHTAKCRDSNYKHKRTKKRWENIQIERLFSKEKVKPVEVM